MSQLKSAKKLGFKFAGIYKLHFLSICLPECVANENFHCMRNTSRINVEIQRKRLGAMLSHGNGEYVRSAAFAHKPSSHIANKSLLCLPLLLRNSSSTRALFSCTSLAECAEKKEFGWLALGAESPVSVRVPYSLLSSISPSISVFVRLNRITFSALFPLPFRSYAINKRLQIKTVFFYFRLR